MYKWGLPLKSHECLQKISVLNTKYHLNLRRILSYKDKKRYSVILCGFDNNEKALPGVIFKGLKRVPKEVRGRKDCFVAVAPGGSMTPDVLKLWIRAVWAKRPTSDVFGSLNILGWDILPPGCRSCGHSENSAKYHL